MVGQPALTPEEVDALLENEHVAWPTVARRLAAELARERERLGREQRAADVESEELSRQVNDLRGRVRELQEERDRLVALVRSVNALRQGYSDGEVESLIREALVGLPEGSERKAPKVCACPQARESDCLLVTLPDGREFHVRGASTIGQAVEALVGLPE